MSNKNQHPWVIVESPGIRVIEHKTSTEETANGTGSCTSSRLVIEASPEIDSIDDGYLWRKYGQKKVRTSPCPRSYYRCRQEGCPVKKIVEKDGNRISTMYDGMHNHPRPTDDVRYRSKSSSY